MPEELDPFVQSMRRDPAKSIYTADEIAERFETKLAPDREREFQTWKAKHAPEDSGYDYDLRGAFVAGLTPDPETGHWPDTFKKANHPTFSVESRDARDFPEMAGRWIGADRGTYSPKTTTVMRFTRAADQSRPDPEIDAAPRTSDIDPFVAAMRGGQPSAPASGDVDPFVAKMRQAQPPATAPMTGQAPAAASVPAQPPDVAPEDPIARALSGGAAAPMELLSLGQPQPIRTKPLLSTGETSAVQAPPERTPYDPNSTSKIVRGAVDRVASSMIEGVAGPWRELTEKAAQERAALDAQEAHEAARAKAAAEGRDFPAAMLPSAPEVPSTLSTIGKSLLGGLSAPFAGFEQASQARDEQARPDALSGLLAAPGDWMRKGPEAADVAFPEKYAKTDPAILRVPGRFALESAPAAVLGVGGLVKPAARALSPFKRVAVPEGGLPAVRGVASPGARPKPLPGRIGKAIETPAPVDPKIAARPRVAPVRAKVAEVAPPPAEIGTEAAIPAKVAEPTTTKPSLWRQAGASEAFGVLARERSPHGIPERYVATDRALALGQGRNKAGVIMELDPEGLDVRAPRSQKPGSEFVESQGGGGERVVVGHPEALTDKLRSVSIPKALPRDIEVRRLESTLGRLGFTREVTPDGVTYRKPPAAEPAPAPRSPEPPAPTVGAGSSSAVGMPEQATPTLGFGQGRGMRAGGRGQSGAIGIPNIRLPRERQYVPSDPVARAAYAEADKSILWKEPTKPIMDRLDEAIRTARSFGRKEAPLAEFERQQMGKNLPGGLEQEAQFAQGGSASQLRALVEQGEFVTKKASQRALADDLRAMRPEQERVLSRYLEAMNESSRYRPRKLDHHLAPDVSDAIIADTTKNHPEVVRAAETIRDTFAFLRSELVEAGVITPEQAKAMADAGDYYGPESRVIERGPAGIGAGGGPLQPGAPKRVTGSKRASHDPLPRVMGALEQHIKAINQGHVGKALLEAYDANPALADATFMREIKGQSFPEIMRKLGEREDFPRFQQDNAGLAPDPLLAAYLKKTKERVLVTNVGGKTRAFEFPRPDLYDAAMGIHEGVELPLGTRTAHKVVRAMGGLFRTGTTILAPAFNLAQLTRDPRTAFVLTADPKVIPYEAPLRTALGYAKMLRGDKGELGKVYRQLGVENILSLDRAQQKAVIRDYTSKSPLRRVGKAVNPRSWLDFVRERAGRIESGPRAGEVEGVLKRRGAAPGQQNIPRNTLVEASAAGNNVTAPFKLGSDASKVVSAYLPFFSARLQANIATAQMAVRRPAAFAARVAMVSVIPRITLWALHKDEDWYKRMPDWQKYGLWHFGDTFQLPTINILDMPAITLEYALNRLNGEDPEAAGHIAKMWIEEALPTGDVITNPGQLVPQAIRGPVEHVAGKDFYTGNDINPAWKENEKLVRPDLVRRPETAEFLSSVSKTLNETIGWKVTPEEIAHLAGSYLGTVGREAVRAAPSGYVKETADIPGIGRFAPRIRISETVNRYYEAKKQLEGRRQAFKDIVAGGKESAAPYVLSQAKIGGYLDKLDKAMTALRTEYERAPSDAAKREVARRMDEIAELGLSITRPFLADVTAKGEPR